MDNNNNQNNNNQLSPPPRQNNIQPHIPHGDGVRPAVIQNLLARFQAAMDDEDLSAAEGLVQCFNDPDKD